MAFSKEKLLAGLKFPWKHQNREPQREVKPETSNEVHPVTWRPLYLRRSVLCLFIAFFCGLIIALEVLSHVSQSRSGLASSKQSLHYSWTYAPAAIFLSITTIWTRAEFQAKQASPARRAEHASDYVSVMQPVALWRALKHKDFIVAAGVGCTLLLRLAIIFSTSLFTLKEMAVSQSNVSVQLNDYFEGNNATFNGPGMQPVNLLSAILFENLSYPEGTTASATYQTFSAPNLPSDSNITVPVNGMQTDLVCEEAELSITTWQRVSQSFANFNSYQSVEPQVVNEFRSSSCTISNYSIATTQVSAQPYENIPYVGEFVNTTCDYSNESRYLVYLVEFHEKTPENEDGSSDMVLDRSSQLICHGNYSRIDMLAHGSAAGNSTARLERIGSESSTFPEVSATDISLWIDQYMDHSLQDSDYRVVQDYNAFYAKNGPYGNQTNLNDPLQIGAYIAGVSGDITQLFEPGALQNIASSYYKAVGAQLLHEALAKQHTSLTTGSAIVGENRVVMTNVSLRVIEVCLALVILQVIAIIILDPRRGVPPYDPNRVSTIGAILLASPRVRQLLAGTGGISQKTLDTYLAGSKYVARQTEAGISIEAKEKNEAWTPFPNFISRMIGFIVILLIIVVLEVLLHFSDVNDGLGDVTDVTYKHYLWTTIPAIVMTLIGLFIGSLTANIRTVAPYAQLQQKSGAKFEQSLGLNFLDALDLTNLVRSIRTNHWAVLAGTLAASGTFFLNIVTSGLFSAIAVPRTIEVNATQKTVFGTIGAYQADTAYQLLGSTYGEVIAEYIIQDNLTYPQWTYDGLVFPELSITSPSPNWSTGEGVYMETRISALRANHSCITKTGAELNASVTRQESSKDYTISLNWPPFTLDPYGPNKTTIIAAGNFLSVTDVQSSYFGIATSPQLLTSEEQSGNATVSLFAWGFFGPDASSLAHITAMTCTNTPEIVETDIRFDLPGFNITDAHPPVPDASTARRAPGIPLSSEPWITSLNDPALYIATLPAYRDLDGFFTALVLGRFGLPLETLRDASGDEATAAAIQRQLAIVQAQELNNYTRVDANGTLDGAPVRGTVTLPTRLRVVQNMASTRVLDVLLGVIVVLGAVGSFALNTDRVLPKSPTSIAAIGSLLADSNFLERFGAVLGVYTDKVLGRVFLKDEKFYLLDEPHESGLDERNLKSAVVGGREHLTIYVVGPGGSVSSQEERSEETIPSLQE
ncbi:hypothetical protein N7468_008401 [Penicillium chermesinum]|uniref:Uncharacterized protein n=1 Tax=Penicillium chermesinum TaxID=63820 RepID=A0A9W9NPQ9_9EURO|nr:uncharacterized protein N7468_008401 [Penicillium chermesinum]KAJ5223859.1 hypothetical protein N7468_008401 [Penicillium chermesinum]